MLKFGFYRKGWPRGAPGGCWFPSVSNRGEFVQIHTLFHTPRVAISKLCSQRSPHRNVHTYRSVTKMAVGAAENSNTWLDIDWILGQPPEGGYWHLFVDLSHFRPGRFSTIAQFVCYFDSLTCSFLKLGKDSFKRLIWAKRRWYMPVITTLGGWGWMARSSKTSLHVIDRPCIKKQKPKSRPILLITFRFFLKN